MAGTVEVKAEAAEAREAKAEAEAGSIAANTINKANRCAQCRRKLTLAMQIPCNCGYNFCAAHRAYEDHPCSYDYRGAARATLRKQLRETGTPCKRTAFGLDAVS